jgi:hypothetical protein
LLLPLLLHPLLLLLLLLLVQPLLLLLPPLPAERCHSFCDVRQPSSVHTG